MLTSQNPTADAYLPDLFIDGLNEDDVAVTEVKQDFLSTFVEAQNRVMGYGPVSNVFSMFLNAEAQELAG